ncbi:MAG: GbsR/MarR family transcriptional regulator [Pseudomonadota bacterium]
MNIPPLVQTFVLHFGEMGSRWGINRTVGQIYALLYVSERPLNAEEISDLLGFSRSNVSMGLKELDSWRLIYMQHIPNDRREYFTTPDDIWVIVRTLIEERKKREIDPTLSMLRDALLYSPTSSEEKHAQHKMQEMHELIEMLTNWYADMQKMETERLVNLLRLGSKVYKLYEIKDKITVITTGKGKKKAEKG